MFTQYTNILWRTDISSHTYYTAEVYELVPVHEFVLASVKSILEWKF